MKTILVKDLFSSAFSESKAVILREEIQKMLSQEDSVVLDFTGITKYTTLFFNFSTGFFVSILGPEEYDRKIQVRGLSDLGESTYRSSYENAIEKYSPEMHEEILNIIGNPQD
ncbi:STAS-like domain-containing protein [Anaerosporobacter sp.]|uniref:STAS-like domain-containing protein n=1 Tax=Anaerosporobacter sp. TaxID=1872529 RepID=UPI00286F759E|nr:STAS-like domain-containing protein [Anaerosporobacter sp.]